jgi:hypothetical protein
VRQAQCEGSRRRSISSTQAATVGSGSRAWSLITTMPPGPTTRAISSTTRCGAGMWWRLNLVTAPSKTASSKGSEVASPSSNSALPSPSAAASSRALSTIEGVRSTPRSEPTFAAKARPTIEGPQATSSQRASGSAGTSSIRAPKTASVRSAPARAKVSVWRVNSSRIDSSYMRPS